MKGRTIVLAGVGAIIIGTAGFSYWANQPVTQKVTLAPQNVKGDVSPDYTLKPLVNAYFKAQLPARYTSRSLNTGTGKPLFLQELFGAPSDQNLYADQMALAIGTTPAGGLNEISDVQLRQRSADYVPLTIAGLPPTSAAFERAQQGYEIGVFIVHDDRYATIVMTGLPSKRTQLIHEMQLFVNSFEWE